MKKKMGHGHNALDNILIVTTHVSSDVVKNKAWYLYMSHRSQ